MLCLYFLYIFWGNTEEKNVFKDACKSFKRNIRKMRITFRVVNDK